jgi:leader peptidase (prepilin peptidase)/N-methyltransferase
MLIAVPVGLAVGSLAGNAALRWPAGRTLGRPARSRCDACDAPVEGLSLLPVLGWILRRGRCGACGTPIDRRHPVMEVGAAALVTAALLGPDLAVGALLAVTGIVLLLAAVLDLEHRWIPDRLTLPSGALLVPLAVAVAVAGAAPVPPHRPLVLGLGVPAVLGAIRSLTVGGRRGPWIGGGDVKLLVPVLAVASLEPSGPAVMWAVTLVAATSLLVVRRIRRSGGDVDGLPLAPPLLSAWCAMLLLRVPTA